ncbi:MULTISPECIES: prepilin-type N-terminal cleavage/methylation domain-containing protein [unclassified Sphingomonas]|uniref:pilus assembly FimT family protein n=1 Tax=Novosphingobium rhizosphaerae TaxID=1551649 RepID=UPI0015CE443A
MSATGEPRAAPHEAGFTLIEMLVTIGIMALGAGLAFPLLQHRLARQGLDTATHDVVLALAKARAQALASGAPVRLDRDQVAVPGGVTITWPRPDTMFYPDGSSSQGAITLSAGATVRRLPIGVQP